MPDWYLNPALSRFRAAVNARYGARRDLESDGTIGDTAHSNRTSDHNADEDGSVDAWDMDVEVNGRGKPYAADVERLKEVFEAHESSGYWIHNDQIARRADNWRRRPYADFNPSPSRNKHIAHVHWNTRQSHENSTKPWVLADSPEEPDMTPQQAQQLRDAHYTTAVAIPNPTGDGRVPLHVWAGWMTGAVKALAAAVGNVDEATRAQLQQDLTALNAAVAALPERTVAEFGAADTAEEIADRLRPALGDKAVEVGQILAGVQA